MCALALLIFVSSVSSCSGLQKWSGGRARAGLDFTIVSAQFGANDKISKLPPLPSGTRGIFYTESPEVAVGTGWVLVQRPYHLERCDDAAWCGLDINAKYSFSRCNETSVRGVMAARFYKMNAYLLPETATADLILWSDSDHLPDLVLPSDVNARAAKLIGDADLVMADHDKRINVAEEVHPAAARASLRTGQAWQEMEKGMREGIAYMQGQGFRDDCGLLVSTQFLFWRNSPRMHRAMDYWWKFNQQYSFRDQISAPWAFKMNDVRINHVCKTRDDPCVMQSIISIGV